MTSKKTMLRNADVINNKDLLKEISLPFSKIFADNLKYDIAKQKSVLAINEKTNEPLPLVLEIKDAARVNELCKSQDFCQPRFSEKRNCYILIRRAK